MATDADRVNSWLHQKYNVVCPRDWLEACIEWIQTENQGRRLGQTELCTHVLDQWLLSDLTDIGASSLPEDCAQQHKVSLPGAYSLQVNAVIDVSSPYYSQLQKVEGTENDNVNVSATQQSQTQAPKAGRMLMFDMTDGNQNIKGMEYQPLPGIDVSMVPGTKVVIQGPVLCRLGVIMLTKRNITVLGGEVESLMTTNSQINMLRKTLNEQSGDTWVRPKCPRHKFEGKPRVKHPSTQPGRNNNPAPSQQFQNPQQGNRNQKQHNVQNNDPNFPDDFDPQHLVAMEQQWDDDDMDYDLLLGDMEPPREGSATTSALNGGSTANPPGHGQQSRHAQQRLAPQTCSFQAEKPRNTTSNNTITPIVIQPQMSPAITNRNGEVNVQPVVIKPDPASSEDFPAELNDSDLLMCDADFSEQMSTPQGNSWQRRVSQPQQPQRQVSQPLQQSRAPSGSAQGRNSFGPRPTTSVPAPESMSFDDDDDDFLQCAIPEEPKAPKKPKLDLHSPPYTYLRILQKHLPVHSVQVIKVKAYVSTLLSRLTHNEGRCWSLKVKINDGSAAMDVDLGDQMLANLIGFTAQRCQLMKAQAKSNKAFRLQLQMGIKQCQKRLIQMSCVMELEVKPNSDCPIVLGYHKLTTKDIAALRNRNCPQ